ncbi:MAG TPA: alkaline phosphatase D family protein [Nocardioidaceae bacterium]
MTSIEIDRRSLLVAGAATTGAVALGLPAADPARANPTQAAASYFQHGVASGDPFPTSVILWTRLTPTADASPGSGVGPSATVRWQVAADERFRRVVSEGSFVTDAGRDHTVKLEATGLQPATTYYYRFLYRGASSRTGRTRTAPAPDASPDGLRFGVVSCANLPGGYFSAYRHLAARDDLDAVLHLGDYLYEYGADGYGDVREPDPAHEMVSLADYRRRHAQYKQDPDLQLLHARNAFIVTWDDHEVTNDAWAEGAENHDPATEGDYLERRARAHRVYDEWMPVRMGEEVALGDGTRLFRRLRFGTLAELSMLDLRTYRSQQAAYPVADGTVSDPDRTITGEEQMAWLKESLQEARAQWKLVGNSVMISPVVFPPLPNDLTRQVNDVTGLLPEDGSPYNVDQWDGYTADRHEVLDHLADHGVRNTVFLTGDIHSGWACDVPLDAGTYPLESGRSVATEFVCTSVTSDNLNDITGTAPARSSIPVEAAIQASNRHVKYLNFDDHGFSVLDVTPARTQMDYFVISERTDPDATVSWTASWATDANTQRVHPVGAPVEESR